MLSTEMFFQSERAYASAIAIIANWLSMFCIIMTFVPLFVRKKQWKILINYSFLFLFLSML